MHLERSYSGESNTDGDSNRPRRLCMQVRGLVQGVGFRPFVYRLATELALTGWVCNSTTGVRVEVEGPADKLAEFVSRLQKEKPPLASIDRHTVAYDIPVGYADFQVRHSRDAGEKEVPVLPDAATCPDCLKEIFDSNNRRYLYPFTNCTNCGPRYSIIESVPYDRDRTTMKRFIMCDECRSEYENPRDRRFHAQPNACAKCGPHLELWDASGKVMARHEGALQEACDVIRAGEILALKGLGGFQLIVDAANEDAIARLRLLKGREEKPFALMYPELALVQDDCLVNDSERAVLLSPASPIVLLRRRVEESNRARAIAPTVAPDNPYLGAMLPYTPLHHLIMHLLGFPIVATSGNRSDEPICIDEHEALSRLDGIADMFLVHNRPIARQVDDSVVQVINGECQVLRNARGYAPAPLSLRLPEKACLAVGAHLKNSFAISRGKQVFVSQHIGDLETAQAEAALRKGTASLAGLYDFRPDIMACDLHPDYISTKVAEEFGLPIVRVQHHYAHVLSGMADNELDGPVLGIAWDGTGLGPDGTVWGGEFLRVGVESFERVASLRPFLLPGNERAIREPRRSALGALFEIYGGQLWENMPDALLAAFATAERQVLIQMLMKRTNCPQTTSVGRLFDATASMLGLCHRNNYEGQAAMMLGFSAELASTDATYDFSIAAGKSGLEVDWAPMIRELLQDIKGRVSPDEMAAKFHNTLAGIIVDVARQVGEKNVVLTGGCFQNRYLTERAIAGLHNAGFVPYWHHRIPPNDGGIALGQIMAAARNVKQES